MRVVVEAPSGSSVALQVRASAGLGARLELPLGTLLRHRLRPGERVRVRPQPGQLAVAA
jgi:hypothetical protein